MPNDFKLSVGLWGDLATAEFAVMSYVPDAAKSNYVARVHLDYQLLL